MVVGVMGGGGLGTECGGGRGFRDVGMMAREGRGCL